MFVITVDLKRLYQITEPGQYTLEISRVAEDDKTIVHSNTVTLNIVPLAFDLPKIASRLIGI